MNNYSDAELLGLSKESVEKQHSSENNPVKLKNSTSQDLGYRSRSNSVTSDKLPSDGAADKQMAASEFPNSHHFTTSKEPLEFNNKFYITDCGTENEKLNNANDVRISMQGTFAANKNTYPSAHSSISRETESSSEAIARKTSATGSSRRKSLTASSRSTGSVSSNSTAPAGSMRINEVGLSKGVFSGCSRSVDLAKSRHSEESNGPPSNKRKISLMELLAQREDRWRCAHKNMQNIVFGHIQETCDAAHFCHVMRKQVG